MVFRFLFPAANSAFFARGSLLISASRLRAALLSAWDSKYTNVTGQRERV